MQSPSKHLDPRRPAALALLLGPGLLAGCHGSAGGSFYYAPPIFQTVHEQEPNDTYLTPQGLGPVYGGDKLEIVGHADFFDTDGFAFVAGEDIEVQVALDGGEVFSDLELCVYDPYLGEYTLCLLSPDSDEFGTFTVAAGYEFHLVVSSAFGGSFYDLEVEVFHLNGLFPYSTDSVGAGDAAEKQPMVRPVDAAAHERGLDGHDAERRRAFDRYLGVAADDASPIHSERERVELGPVGRLPLLPTGFAQLPGQIANARFLARAGGE